jgi:hypothetical protein
LRLIDDPFVVIKRAFRAILTSDLRDGHTTHDGVYSRANIDVRTVGHQRDLIAGCELVFDQGRSSDTLGAAHEAPPGMSARLEVDGGGLTLLSTLEFEADRLALIEGLESSPLDGRNMDENVLGAVGRLNESETLLGVKPFYST